MHIDGSYRFNAPVQAVWDTLLNPDTIAGCMPGCEEFQPTGPDEFRAAMRIKVGPIVGSYSGKIRLLDQEPPLRYRMDVEGGGGPGHMTGSGLMTLTDEDGATVVSYEGDAAVTGKIAVVGQRLMGAAAKMMIGQFFGCMEKKLPS